MSSGARIPLADAWRVVDGLYQKWGLDRRTVFVAGSIRRQAVDVGDIDLLAPVAPASGRDELFDRIAATVDNPPAPAGIFEAAAAAEPDPAAIATAVRGLKPGFLAADLVVRAWKGTVELKVQISRYTRENLGWQLIYKTGPVEFGRWFLFRWKQRYGIPAGDERFKASIDGHLVNLDKKVVPVESEEEAFAKCGLQPVPPAHREAFAQRVQAMAQEKRA